MDSPAPIQAKANWFIRHKVFTGFSVLLLLVLFAISFRTTNQTAVQGISISTAPTPTLTAIPSPTPSSTPTPTDTPTPTSTPSPIPTKVYIAPTQSTIQSAQPTASQDQGLSNSNYYMNSSGNEVHSPAYSNDGSVPAGATAKCSDGTYSFSQHRSGTCSHHGGVADWL